MEHGLNTRDVSQAPRALKGRRISRACDFCHRRGIRCRPSQENPAQCQNCADFGQGCTYNRTLKRRGGKVAQVPVSTPSSNSRDNQRLFLPNCSAPGAATAGSSSPLNGVDITAEEESKDIWRPPFVASQALIADLIDVYFEVVYPIFPFFHRPTLTRLVSRAEYLTNQDLFAAIMSICALASARARDGAVFSERWDLDTLREPSSEVFFDAAGRTIPKDLTTAPTFNYMRACALLAITAIQYGRVRVMHQYIGLYHTLVAMDGLQDELNWAKQMSIVEREERRRLFWSTYTLEIYTSIAWGGINHCREAQSNVLYPSEVDDEFFSNSGFQESPVTSPGILGQNPGSSYPATGTISWLRGWNFTTSLYRILEHAVDQFHRRRPQDHQTSRVQAIFAQSALSQSSVLNEVMLMYGSLPQRFKETRPVTKDVSEDRYNFQAANIAATVQLVRMVLFAAEGATIEEKCQIAGELLDGFKKVPIAYLKALSSPLLHHLAGIGSILGSVFEEPLPETSFLQVRTVLLAMADLLANLEMGLYCTAGASERLRSIVSRINSYMQEQRQLAISSHMPNALESTNTTENCATVDQVTTSSTNGFEPYYPQFQLPPELLQDWPWALDFGPFVDYS